MNARRNAARRGKSLENRVAEILGGDVWAGLDGDVEARGYRIECKHRNNLNLETTATLRDWITQVQRYEATNPGKPFALAFSGGKPQGGRIWVATDIKEFIRLTDLERDERLLAEFVERYPDHTERIQRTTLALVTGFARERGVT